MELFCYSSPPIPICCQSLPQNLQAWSGRSPISNCPTASPGFWDKIQTPQRGTSGAPNCVSPCISHHLPHPPLPTSAPSFPLLSEHTTQQACAQTASWNILCHLSLRWISHPRGSLCFSPPSASICSSSDYLSLGGRFSFLCCCSTTPILITGCITVHCKYLFPLLQEALKSEGAILNLRVAAQNPVQHLAHSTLCSSDEWRSGCQGKQHTVKAMTSALTQGFCNCLMCHLKRGNILK